MTKKKIIKVIYIDDEEYVWCSHEKEYFHNENFNINKDGNYYLYCNDCSDMRYDERSINYTQGAIDRNLYVENQSKLMLENIGYDYNSDLTIHQQFMIKNNLI